MTEPITINEAESKRVFNLVQRTRSKLRDSFKDFEKLNELLNQYYTQEEKQQVTNIMALYIQLESKILNLEYMKALKLTLS